MHVHVKTFLHNIWYGGTFSEMGYNRRIREEIELHKDLASVYVEKRYGPAFSRIYQAHWNAKMCQIAELEAGARVLDLGCGTGILFPALVDSGYEVLGLDLSYEMLIASCANSLKVDRVCADGGHIPAASDTFDAVFCRGSIHHFPSLDVGFREIARVLRKGGCLIFSEPSDDSVVNRWARNMMYAKSEEFHEEDEGFRRRKIIPLLKATGFDIEYSRGFGFFGYVFAGFPDKLGILEKVPGSGSITRLLIAVDNVLEMLPYINTLALHWQVRARKR